MADENDDITIDPDSDRDDSVVAEEHQGETIRKLREKLRSAEEKAREYLDSWQRAQADFLNIRKRDEEARKEFSKFVSEKLISELIPVLDSLNLAFAHGNKDIEPVYKQLLSVLRSNGLEELDPLGETFNPREHESVGTVETEDKDQDHKILEVVSKGYILSGKIIRPAKVKIGTTNG